MSQEEKIEGEFIGKYLGIVRRAHAILLDQKLKPFSISHGQISLFITIYKQAGISQSELCNIFNLDKAGVTRSIKKMVQAGLVEKRSDPQDKRRKELYLTDKGEEFVPQLSSVLQDVEKRVRKNLSQEEIDNCLQTMKKICVNLDVTLE